MLPEIGRDSTCLTNAATGLLCGKTSKAIISRSIISALTSAITKPISIAVIDFDRFESFAITL